MSTFNNDTPKQITKGGRQGDVLLIRVDDNVETGAPVAEEQAGKTILAHGEVTGHHHRFEGPGVELFSIPNEPDDRVVKCDGLNFLRHEEHSPILPAKGTFIVRIQEEYAYGTTRRVAD